MYGSILENMTRYMGDIDKFSSNKKSKLDYSINRSDVKEDHVRCTQQSRNEPCNCGSGKKFKKCCGKVVNEETVVEEVVMGDFRDGYNKTAADDRAKKSGFISIEEAEKQFKERYADAYDLNEGLELKAWIGYCRSRSKNGNLPTTFRNYVQKVTTQMLREQVEFGMINCDDIGGKEFVLEHLTR